MNDPRIPVRFATAALPSDAALVEGNLPVSACHVARFTARDHAPGCACCTLHAPVALALNQIFLENMRARGAPLTEVVAVTETAAGLQAIKAALARDPLIKTRFRMA